MSLLVREDPTALRNARELGSGDELRVPVIVVGEALYGIRRLPPGQRRDSLRLKLEGLLGGLVVQDLPPGAAAAYAEVKAEAQQRGRPLGDNDCWIAATAILLGATLVTRDADFEAVPPLRLATWAT